MSKVVSLGDVPPPDQAVPETVELLERMLAQAKAGHLRAVAVVGTTNNHHVTTAWTSGGEFYKLLGAASWLIHRMNSQE